MAENIARHITHIKSKVVENGSPKLPTAAQIQEGEIGVNYAKGLETLSIKNESGDVVTFSSDNYYTEKKLGSGFTGANSANTVTKVIEDNELVWTNAYVAMSGIVSAHTASTSMHLTSAEKTKIDNMPSTFGTMASEDKNNYYTKSDTSGKTEIATALNGKANTATTLGGYGITDAKIVNGTITLGNQTITPLTSYTAPITSVTTSSTNGNISVNGSNVLAYTHPTSAGNKHIPSGGTSGQFLGYYSAGTAKWVANPNTDNYITGATVSGNGEAVNVSLSGNNNSAKAKASFTLSAVSETSAGLMTADMYTGIGESFTDMYQTLGDMSSDIETVSGSVNTIMQGLRNLGNAAFLNTGTTAGTVAAGDHTHTGTYATNTFSKIKINASTTTIDADSTGDTFTISGGSFISLTQDTTNDKVTINVNTGDTSSTVAVGNHEHTTYQLIATSGTSAQLSAGTDATQRVWTAAQIKGGTDALYVSKTPPTYSANTYTSTTITSSEPFVYALVRRNSTSSLTNQVCPVALVDGQQCNVIYQSTGSSAYNVSISTNSGYITPDNQGLTLNVPAYGYAEVNYINIKGVIFARGV